MIRLPLPCTLLLLAIAAPAGAMAKPPIEDSASWDCGSWGAGMTQLTGCRPCYGKRAKLKRKVTKTVAHRDRVHIGMTKPGAAARTSFWSRGR